MERQPYIQSGDASLVCHYDCEWKVIYWLRVGRKSSTAVSKIGYQVTAEMLPILSSTCGVTCSMTCQRVIVALGEIKIVLGDTPENRRLIISLAAL